MKHIKDLTIPISEISRKQIRKEIVEAKKQGFHIIQVYAKKPISPYATFDLEDFDESGREMLDGKVIA